VYIFYDILLNFCQNKKCSKKIYRESQNTQFIFSKFLPENHAIYEIMWKNCARAKQPTDDCKIQCTCLHAW